MRPLRLYAHRPVPPSMFDPSMPGNVFESPRVERVDTPRDADWCVCPRLKPLLPIIAARPRCNYLIWTNEPRHSRATRPSFRVPGGSRFVFMNVYTGDVFWHNHHFVGSVHCDTRLSLGVSLDEPLRRRATAAQRHPGNRKLVAAIWHHVGRRSDWVVGGIDRDLEVIRRDCALAGHRRGLLDIYGRGWPNDIAKPFAGYPVAADGTPWWITKLRLLADYRFNLCVESTNYDHFCTEKIWQSIIGGCLPVYWGGGNRICDAFPNDSFVDLSLYASYDALYDHVSAMTDAEYVHRYNRCVDAYNAACVERRESIEGEPAEHVRRILARLGSF